MNFKFFDLNEIKEKTKETKLSMVLKNLYFDLVKKYHPDTSGYDSKSDFQNLQNEYNYLINYFQNTGGFYTKKDGTKQQYEDMKNYGNIVIDIFNTGFRINSEFFKNIKVFVVGIFIYMEGLERANPFHEKFIKTLKDKYRVSLKNFKTKETYEKEQFIWIQKEDKLFFCYRPYWYKKINRRKIYSFKEITNMYGKTEVRNKHDHRENKRLKA